MNMSKRTIWISVGVVVIIAVVAGLGLGESGIAIDTDTVAQRTVRVVVANEGQTRVVDRYTVAAPVSGLVDRIQLREGDAVEAGDVVATIRPLPTDDRTRQVLSAGLEAALARRAQVAAQLEDATQHLQQAERDLGRIRTLARDSILSRQELETAELGLASAKQAQAAAHALQTAADADVSAARAQLSGTSTSQSSRPMAIRAPDSGRVLRIAERSQRAVAAGSPILEIGNEDALEIVVDVLSEDAVRIDPGDRVVIENWGGELALEGRVRIVEPSAFTRISALGVEEQRVNVVIDLLARPERLGAGYRVEASIIVWEQQVLSVPTSALFRQDGEWRVFQVDEGTATLKTVQPGQRSADYAEVLAGLADGDVVVIHPTDQLQSGVKVRDRR